MSRLIPEQRIRQRLTQLIPVPLNELPNDDLSCYICLEPYPHLEHGGDYPVRMQESTCRHIFGRLCIEEHITSNQSYSTRCPICREQWFTEDEHHQTWWEQRASDLQAAFERLNEEHDRDDLERVRRYLELLSTYRGSSVGNLPPLDEDNEEWVSSPSSRDLMRRNIYAEQELRRNEPDHPEYGLPNADRIMRTVDFLRQVLLNPELQSEDRNLGEGVTEVERAVGQLCRRLDDIRLRRRFAGQE
jgi:hypothetical protein